MAHWPAGTKTSLDEGGFDYECHRPEQTLFYQLVKEYYSAFVAQQRPKVRYEGVMCSGGFEDYLKCGRLEHGFLLVLCDTCHAEHLVAFSCRWRGFCPSCGARRMGDSAALLVDEVLPRDRRTLQ